MKQLLILSGKGGTGKTTVAGAMIRLSGAVACADCDVDAPNLHLVLKYDGDAETKDYFGLPRAHINEELCTRCGICSDKCRFGAIEIGVHAEVDPYACEGCGLCKAVCPSDAVEMCPAVAGDLMLYSDLERGVFSTAQLRMGNGTTGLLVTEVKKQMKKAAGDASFAIIDGSPGIGCPVIASVTGVNTVLVVAEPSLSGISDMERVLYTAECLGPLTAVCVNKADTNPAMTERIRSLCSERGVRYLGEIPYDPEVVRVVNGGLTLADVECPAGEAVRAIFEKVVKMMDTGEHR
ncbi:MAG: hypothetical protein PWR17_262 [Candidatus Methanomethylophilaceae archaeon]|nr:hypothetical protein [Candidatus Methanomethylophilaceae archaeon]